MQRNITIQYQSVPRFELGDMEAVAHLDEHGFVVLANALSAQEAEHAMSLLWDYLEGLGTGIDRTDVSSWDDDRCLLLSMAPSCQVMVSGTVRPSGISVISPRSNRPLPKSGIPMICWSVLTELQFGDLGLIRATGVRTKAIAGCTLTSTRLAGQVSIACRGWSIFCRRRNQQAETSSYPEVTNDLHRYLTSTRSG